MAFHRGGGRLATGAVLHLAARPLQRAAGVPRPVCPGRGQCWRGDPAPVPQRRAPLQADVARCEGGGRASPGGVPSHCSEGRLSSGAPPSPAARPLGWVSGSATHVLWARCAGVGAQHCALGLHALWGLRAAGAVGSRPRGGWPFTVVRSVWCQALSPTWPPVPWGRQPGFREPVCPGCGWCGHGDPAPALQRRAPLPAVVARCWGGGRASLGGVPFAVVRGI